MKYCLTCYSQALDDSVLRILASSSLFVFDIINHSLHTIAEGLTYKTRPYLRTITISPIDYLACSMSEVSI